MELVGDTESVMVPTVVTCSLVAFAEAWRKGADHNQCRHTFVRDV